MDLAYPPEAEAFRTEIRDWLTENLPEGWFEPGFELSGDIQQAVRAKGYTRYKLIVTVTIVEACQQGMRLASRCLWDPETDNFAEYTYSSETMHATVLVFGLYWE